MYIHIFFEIIGFIYASIYAASNKFCKYNQGLFDINPKSIIFIYKIVEIYTA